MTDRAWADMREAIERIEKGEIGEMIGDGWGAYRRGDQDSDHILVRIWIKD